MIEQKLIARVFPRKTNMSPTDDLAFFGYPTIEAMAMLYRDESGQTNKEWRKFQREWANSFIVGKETT